MTASTRPTFIPRTDWRIVPVVLSADEQVALNKLAQRERLEKADMAALIVRLELERCGLLPRKEE